MGPLANNWKSPSGRKVTVITTNIRPAYYPVQRTTLIHPPTFILSILNEIDISHMDVLKKLITQQEKYVSKQHQQKVYSKCQNSFISKVEREELGFTPSTPSRSRKRYSGNNGQPVFKNGIFSYYEQKQILEKLVIIQRNGQGYELHTERGIHWQGSHDLLPMSNVYSYFAF